MRNFVAKDLRTPKYKMRVVVSKKTYKRKPKHLHYVQKQEDRTV